MSHRGLPRWGSIDRLDLAVAWIALVASVLLLGLRLVATQVLILVIPLAAAAGSAVYLLVHARGEASVVGRGLDVRTIPVVPRVIAGYLPAVVLFGLAGYVIAIHRAGARTDAIYLLTGLVGVIVFAQILFVRDEQLAPGLVLIELVVAAIVFRLATLFVTPGFVGVDIWTHATVFVDGIAQTGSLAPLAESKYLLAPTYHLLGAVGTLAFDSARMGIYLTVGLVVPIAVVFVYGTARQLVTVRWALLATAIVAFSDQFVRWGMHLIPTSLGFAAFLAVLYAMTRLLAGDSRRWPVGLLLLASLAIVFTHQVTTAITLVCLGNGTLIAVGAALSDSDRLVGGVGPPLALGGVFAITLGTTIAAWSAAPFAQGGQFLWGELAVVWAALTQEAGFLDLASVSTARDTISGPLSSGPITAAIPYVELFGFALLVVAAVLGGLTILRWRDHHALGLTLLSIGAGLFVVVFGLSMFGVHALLPGRWLVFLYVALALIGAVGLSSLGRSDARRLAVVGFVLLAVGYPTTMVVAEKATLESPAFENQHARFAYTEAEIGAVTAIADLHSPATHTIATDHPYVTLFRRVGGYGYDASILPLGTDGPEATATVARDYQASGPVTFHRSTTAPVSDRPTAIEAAVCPPEWSVNYANDDVRFCTAGSSGGDR